MVDNSFPNQEVNMNNNMNNGTIPNIYDNSSNVVPNIYGNNIQNNGVSNIQVNSAAGPIPVNTMGINNNG